MFGLYRADRRRSLVGSGVQIPTRGDSPPLQILAIDVSPCVINRGSAEGNVFRPSVGVSIPRSIRSSLRPIDFASRESGFESATVGASLQPQ